jgi:nucleoside-diphosphate-sugar epimerase
MLAALDESKNLLVHRSERILITGAGGFIGSRVVSTLLEHGFRNLRCLVRPSSDIRTLRSAAAEHGVAELEIIVGNLLSHEACASSVANASIILHLAAGIDKSFPGAFMNSVVTTRNLLEAAMREAKLRRFVNVSSFAIYSNKEIKRGGLLDERAMIEADPKLRGNAYTYGKAKQEELVLRYAREFNLPVTIVRPGAVFGPGMTSITGRVGINTFGVFFHLGGRNRIPFTYVDNCADAIVLAGVSKGLEGEVFNVVDDDLPTSRDFLAQYKKNVRSFRSLSIPYYIFYVFCGLWEWYARWSRGQLPPVFTRSRAESEWKGNTYSNEKIKRQLGWRPRVPMSVALERYFTYQREASRRRSDA